MAHWIALLPAPPATPPASPPEPAAVDADALGWWALQYTPRVARLDEAVVLDVHASERLFGGHVAVRQRVVREALQWGVRQWACAHTAHAALALARGRPAGLLPCPLDVQAEASVTSAHPQWHTPLDASCICRQLDALPLHSLRAVAEQAATLSRMGCRRLGQVRALPRGGLSRRFGDALLHALDQAHGSRPEPLAWLTLPPIFQARLELPARVDTAPALQAAFEHLLRPLCAWLAGQHAGTEAVHLSWCLDNARHADARWQTHTLRLARPTRDVRRLSQLLGEHLLRIPLASPVSDVAMEVRELVPWQADELELFPQQAGGMGMDAGMAPRSATEQRAQHEQLLTLLERLSVRLGPQRVQVAQARADHRLEQAQCWQPALPMLAGMSSTPTATTTPSAHLPDHPLPRWVCPQPLPLSVLSDGIGLRERPFYQGPLQLLAGPHRTEAGWWDIRPEAPFVARDHYLASSPQAGLLWIYKSRHAPDEGLGRPWFLHGFFA